MRYADSHKQETHKALLAAAAAQLREKGPDRLSIARVMKAAGLTHGGFYAHFKSRDALLDETLTEIFAAARRPFARLHEKLPPRPALAAYIDLYLSTAHRDNIAGGCPIAALAGDMPRQSKKLRAAFEAGLKSVCDGLAERMEAAGIADAAALAPSVLSAMSGAIALARGISDRKLSAAMLAATRAGLKARLGLEAPDDSR